MKTSKTIRWISIALLWIFLTGMFIFPFILSIKAALCSVIICALGAGFATFLEIYSAENR